MTRNKRRIGRRERDRQPRSDGSTPSEKWRDSEQHTAATEAAAQELIERSGSAERAKDAIDLVDDSHPP